MRSGMRASVLASVLLASTAAGCTPPHFVPIDGGPDAEAAADARPPQTGQPARQPLVERGASGYAGRVGGAKDLFALGAATSSAEAGR